MRLIEDFFPDCGLRAVDWQSGKLPVPSGHCAQTPITQLMSEMAMYRQLKARHQFTVIREPAVLVLFDTQTAQPRGCLSLSVLVWIGVSDPLAHSRPFPCH
jgi:hypothetical protein